MTTHLAPPPMEMLLMETLAWAGPEADYDAPTTDFLVGSARRLFQLTDQAPGLLQVVSLGQRVPWLYLFVFATKSLGKSSRGEIGPLEQHAIAVRYPVDALRRADRWEMLRYLGPFNPGPFHPNIAPPPAGAICLQVYPGEDIASVALSLHDLLRFRLRQTDERDALNHEACQYVRTHVPTAIDERPLFGQKHELTLQPLTS